MSPAARCALHCAANAGGSKGYSMKGIPVDGCYFFLHKMAGVNPLHKPFYVMVLWGYSPAMIELMVNRHATVHQLQLAVPNG